MAQRNPARPIARNTQCKLGSFKAGVMARLNAAEKADITKNKAYTRLFNAGGDLVYANS